VPELVYHGVVLDRLPGPQPLAWQSWWAEFLDRSPTNAEPWDELVEALNQDTELQEMLSPQDYERLCADAQKRAAKAQS
jgi:hypothetical protein